VQLVDSTRFTARLTCAKLLLPARPTPHGAQSKRELEAFVGNFRIYLTRTPLKFLPDNHKINSMDHGQHT
jgi:hypothetical protein